MLLWDITVSDKAVDNQYPSTDYHYYIRLKIFTDRGVKNFQAPDIYYSRRQHISQVASRTVQADGTVQGISKADILDRVLEKRKGVNDRAISLAMPNVKPGTIIEYRWNESHDNELANNVALPAGREIPMEHVVYHVKTSFRSVISPSMLMAAGSSMTSPAAICRPVACDGRKKAYGP